MALVSHLRWLSLSLSLAISACGGGNSENSLSNEGRTSKGDGQQADYADLYAFKSTSPYADVLPVCARDDDNSACSLLVLPLLGMETMSPSVDDILSRLVVSHEWMGVRFEAMLNTLPNALLAMFRGVTAIVIDDDIRPAYYTFETGAIYLDPDFLWLSAEEAGTINPKEDYRAGFDDGLAFKTLGRYIKDGDYAYNYVSFREPEPRELEDITLLLANLLLHELAHANDFFPPDSLSSISLSQSVEDAAWGNIDNWISNRLIAVSPLSSRVMFNLAEVMFRGETPTSLERQLTAVELGNEFEPDDANDDYSYTSQYEDLAMLFEEAMMKYLFDVDRDFAFTNRPGEDALCADHIVGWGVRNRVGDTDVKDRANFVVDTVLPLAVSDMFFQDLTYPTALQTNVDWCTALNINASPGSTTLQKPSQARTIPMIDFHRAYR